MVNIDNLSEMQKLDKSNVLGSVDALSQQCLHAWEEVSKINIPANYKEVNKVLVCGMGGSALGAHVIQALFSDSKIMIDIKRSYDLPGWVDDQTLIILSSYSGSTEETISCAKQALAKKLKCLIIATGGQLGEIAEKENIPWYKINPTYNPSNQPRMAVGYSIFGQIALLAQTGLIDIQKDEVKDVINFLENREKGFKPTVESSVNFAKSTAQKILGKIPVLVAADFLEGSVHVFNNQLNENAKNFSNFAYIPELNHHLMEGLKFPESNPKNLVFIFFKSSLYSEIIQKRFALTKDVVEKNNLSTVEVRLTGQSRLEQVFEVIQFGAFTAFYLSMLNNLDPAPIPWVDYFKEQLKK